VCLFLHDGQFADVSHARIARRVIVPQDVALYENRNARIFVPSRLDTRDVMAIRHQT
jgi:hypothetical protein